MAGLDIQTTLRRLATLEHIEATELQTLITICLRSNGFAVALQALESAFPDLTDPRRAQLTHALRDAQQEILARFPPHQPFQPPAGIRLIPRTFSIHKHHLCAIAEGPVLLQWTLDTGRCLLPKPLPTTTEIPVALVSTGETLVALTSRGTIIELDTQKELAPPQTPPALSLRIQAGQLLAVLQDNSVLLLNPPAPTHAELGATRFQLQQQLPPGTLRLPALHLEQRMLAAASAGAIHIWHLDTGFPLRRIDRAHMRIEEHLRETLPERRRRASVRRPAPPEDTGTVGEIAAPPRHARLLELQWWGKNLLVAFEDGMGGLLRADDGALVKAFDLEDTLVALGSDLNTHRLVAITGRACHDIHLDAEPKTRVRSTSLPTTLYPEPDGCGFAHDSKMWFVGDGHTRELWTHKGPELWTLGHPSPPHQLEITPDGRILISADRAGTVRWWSARSGTLLGMALCDVNGALRPLVHPAETFKLAGGPDFEHTSVYAYSASLPESSDDHSLTHLAFQNHLTLTLAGDHSISLELIRVGFEGAGLRLKTTFSPTNTQVAPEQDETGSWSCLVQDQRLQLSLPPETEIFSARLHPDARSVFLSTDKGLLRLRLAWSAMP